MCRVLVHYFGVVRIWGASTCSLLHYLCAAHKLKLRERERSPTHPNGRTLGSGNGRPREDGVARLGSGVVALP